MKVTVPVADVDSLLTREDFIKKLEECVNSENAHIMGVALHSVNVISKEVALSILNVLKMASIVHETNPELAANIARELMYASTCLAELRTHFEKEQALMEAANATKH